MLVVVASVYRGSVASIRAVLPVASPAYVLSRSSGRNA